MKTALLSALGILSLTFIGTVSAQSFVITDTISDTVGSTAIITGSGSKDNTTIWSEGVVGTFEINGGLYYLQVSATNPTGELDAGTDSLMVARTVNSQGLEDTGTLSVYVNTGVNDSRWSLDLTFEFFSDISLTIPVNVDLLLTSLDIDYNQRYYTNSTDFSSVTLYPGTDITTAPAVAGYNGYTASGDAVFNDPQHAVSSFGAGKSSFRVRIDHNTGAALYMFEFRDPSSIVPEPGTVALAVGAFSVLTLMRRRASRA